jgi:hypothetical protein
MSKKTRKSYGRLIKLAEHSDRKHIVFYNVRVTPSPLTSPGTNPHFSDIHINFK